VIGPAPFRSPRVRAACLAVLAAGLGVACAPRPRTQVLVVVRAEPAIASATRSLRVRVLGGADLMEERAVETLGRALSPVSFPVEIALVPVGQDASRSYRVEVAAIDESGREVIATSVRSGFIERRTLRLPLQLRACCVGMTCGEGQSCGDRCACEPELVAPETLADYGSDAGAPDAFDPGADAHAEDAPPVIPTDAPACAGDCFDLRDIFSGGINISPATVAMQWAPPLDGCPATSVSPAADRAYRMTYLYNGAASARTVELTTANDPLSPSPVDMALVVYDVAYAGAGLPSDVRACRAYADDTAGIAPEASVTLTMAPGETILAVLSRETPGSLATEPVALHVELR